MLTAGITDKREIPHEPGEWIEIRKLSWAVLKEARDVRQEAVFGHARAMGGDVMGNLPKRCRTCGEDKHEGKCPPPEERTDASAADPGNDYDTGVLLHAGIVAWSYDKPCTPKNIDAELDEPTALWAKNEIVAYNTKPSEEEQGN